jgi:hypothetical protein
MMFDTASNVVVFGWLGDSGGLSGFPRHFAGERGFRECNMDVGVFASIYVI